MPRRVWGSGRYSPGAVAWHAQITALQARPDHCRAAVARLAGWMGDSKRSGERYLAELSAPGPDGIPELTTIRHTDAAGDGETAERFTRGLTRAEHYAYVPVLAAKTLRHPLFVLYCAIAYATATRTPVTAAELAALLQVAESTARRMTTELERLGWITVHRRTGAHGRHTYETHDRPLHPVPDDPAPPRTDGGSGACTDGGSLAIKEDPGLTDSGELPPTPVLGIRRRRPTATSARERAAVDAFGRRRGLDLTPGAWHLVHRVLAPVRHMLDTLTGWEWERLVGDVLARLHAGDTPERLHDRLERRYARMHTGPADTGDDPGRIRSGARWLLGAGLVRHGCEDPDCETGTRWSTGTDCPVCVLRHQTAAARTRHPTEPRDQQRDPGHAPDPPPRPTLAPPPPPPPGPPARRVGPPPGGWRALVARERPTDTTRVYATRWTGDHATHLPDATGT
ncbi:helix-turn-helix domain-containing protein [Streptomyces sp. NPDC088789]|uniref:helix-turn-helix domain-containing protein n=1 Tax=Streptomyces sp. NPDC088789 TaxID=3365899 RepID=UPI00380E0D5F